MMAMPMIVLYNMSILLAWRVTVKRERKQAAEQALDKDKPKKPAKPKPVIVIEEDELADDEEWEYEDVADDDEEEDDDD